MGSVSSTLDRSFQSSKGTRNVIQVGSSPATAASGSDPATAADGGTLASASESPEAEGGGRDPIAQSAAGSEKKNPQGGVDRHSVSRQSDQFITDANSSKETEWNVWDPFVLREIRKESF